MSILKYLKNIFIFFFTLGGKHRQKEKKQSVLFSENCEEALVNLFTKRRWQKPEKAFSELIQLVGPLSEVRSSLVNH